MGYRVGDIFYTEFVSSNISGVVINMDSLPLGTLFHNSVDDFTIPVFVSNIDVGRYAVSGNIPNYSLPAYVGVVISGYIAGSLLKGIFDFGPLDRAVSVTGVAPVNFIGTNAVVPGVTVSITGGLPQVTMFSGGFDTITIGNMNFRQAFDIMASVIAGSSVVNGNNITYYEINNNTISRVTSTAISGARQSIVLMLP